LLELDDPPPQPVAPMSANATTAAKLNAFLKFIGFPLNGKFEF
jgi:hypothetical protein